MKPSNLPTVSFLALRILSGAVVAAAVSVPIGCPQPVRGGGEVSLTYYVAPDGNDSNPGTEAQPWRTLAKAASMATGKVTVYVREGTYKERLTLGHSGTAEEPITFMAYPGDSVAIDGSVFGTPPEDWWKALIEIDGLSYIKIVGMRVLNSAGIGIRVTNSSHITIEKNYTNGTFGPGILVWGCDHVTIDGNEVVLACTGAPQETATFGVQECISVATTATFQIANNRVHEGLKEGIDVKVGSSNGIVSGNVVYNQPANRSGIYLDAWDSHEFNIDVFDNISHDNGNGFDVASENGGLIEAIKLYHNLAYNNSRGLGVAGWGIGQSHPIKNIEIYANKSYGNQVGCEIAGFTGTAFDGIKVYNNLIYRNTSVGVRITRYDNPSGDYLAQNIEIVNNTIFENGTSSSGFDDGGINVFNVSPVNLLIRNNLLSGNVAFTICVHPLDSTPLDVTIDHNLFDRFRNFYCEIQGSSPILGDPALLNSSISDFHLSAQSAAIDSGSPLNAPSVDFDGNARPRGNGIDIGAFEFTE